MGYDVTWFVTEPPEQYKCAICTDVFCDPVTTRCGHTYCRACITEWLSTTRQCPECRDPIAAHDISNVPVAFKQLVNALQVTCPEEGCGDIMALDALDKHREKCVTEKRPCPQCHSELFKREMAQHNCIQHLKAIIEERNQHLKEVTAVKDKRIAGLEEELRLEKIKATEARNQLMKSIHAAVEAENQKTEVWKADLKAEVQEGAGAVSEL